MFKNITNSMTNFSRYKTEQKYESTEDSDIESADESDDSDESDSDSSDSEYEDYEGPENKSNAPHDCVLNTLTCNTARLRKKLWEKDSRHMQYHSMYEFEPFEWACNIFKKDRFAIFCKVFFAKYPSNYYEVTLKTCQVQTLFMTKCMSFCNMHRDTRAKIQPYLERVFCLLSAQEHCLYTKEETKQKIASVITESRIPDFMNIIALVAKDTFYDLFVRLYHGNTTAVICRDIFQDLRTNKSKYKNMCHESHRKKMLETLGCHLVHAKHIMYDESYYRYYLATIVLLKAAEGNTTDALNTSIRLAKYITQPISYY